MALATEPDAASTTHSPSTPSTPSGPPAPSIGRPASVAPGDRRAARRRWLTDHRVLVAVAELVVVEAAMLASMGLSRRANELGGSPDRIPWWLSIAWTLALTIPFVLRRWRPAGSFVVAALAFTGMLIWSVPEGTLSSIVVFISLVVAGEHGGPRRTPARAAGCTAMLIGFLVFVFRTDLPEEYQPIFRWNLVVTLLFNVFVFALGWLLGDVLRRRADRERILEERTAQLERERELNARRAVLDERVRIARELHDVVAHHVSVMGVQAGAARRVLTREPDRAIAALATVETSSRQAVDELRRLVGFLRNDEIDQLAPVPGLERLTLLVTETVEGTELTVSHTVEGTPIELPVSVSRSAYRVVQEALTNTIKHARARRVDISVRYQPGALVVEVRDDGVGFSPPGASPLPGERLGLRGMRERVALHEGTLVTGPHRQGGYQVLARFPTGQCPRDEAS